MENKTSENTCKRLKPIAWEVEGCPFHMIQKVMGYYYVMEDRGDGNVWTCDPVESCIFLSDAVDHIVEANAKFMRPK